MPLRSCFSQARGHRQPGEMGYGRKTSTKPEAAALPFPPEISRGLLTRAAGVPVEAQGTLVAVMSRKIHVASALASWAAVVVHRTPGIAGASWKSRTINSLMKRAARGQPLRV